MAMYTIIDGGYSYNLHATLTGGVTFTGKTTDRPLEDGSIVSDHYVNNPTTASMTGVISDANNFNGNATGLTTLDFIDNLKELKTSGRVFTLVAVASDSLTLGDCVFTELRISNDQTHGAVGDSFSFNISANIKQIRKGSKAKIVNEESLEANDIAEVEEGAGTNQKITIQDEIEKTQAARDAIAGRTLAR